VTEPVVKVRGVELAFSGVKALQGVDFDVFPDELFAVIGPNGAGKTSIFNVLSGVYRPQQGSVEFAGTDLRGLRPHRIANLGMARTFQNIELFENLDVVDNLMLGRHAHLGYGWPSAVAWLGRAKHAEIVMNGEETEDMARFILDIRDELHIPMILVEHDMGLVMDLADRVMAMDFGKPVATGTPHEVQTHPDVIRAYLGPVDDSVVAELQEDLA